MQIHLIIPSLDLQDHQALIEHAPSLANLIAQGRPHDRQWPGFENRVAEVLGFEMTTTPVPFAALIRHALGRPSEGHWLCATPVFLEIGIEKILLHDLDASSLAREEASALVAAFNQHFADDGLSIELDRSGYWFIRLPEHRVIHTQSLSMVRGQSIYPLLPDGEQSAYWHGWMNEVQMLFFNHPVNISRERRGEQPINGLWLWGEGEIMEPVEADWDLIMADDTVSKALARFTGVDLLPLYDGIPYEGHYERVLVVIDELQMSTAHGDYDTWEKAIKKLESEFFRPVCDAWNQRKIKALCIESDGVSIEVAERSRWRFWRRC
jgi:hypothetical protein